MKLTELNPKWLVGDVMKYFPVERHGMGISFDCLVHRDHKLAVMFVNPIDGKPAAEVERRWNRTGETFDTLTLTPSIDASGATHEGTKCWHGFITGGDVNP